MIAVGESEDAVTVTTLTCGGRFVCRKSVGHWNGRKSFLPSLFAPSIEDEPAFFQL
jgi:hypothetical protein